MEDFFFGGGGLCLKLCPVGGVNIYFRPFLGGLKCKMLFFRGEGVRYDKKLFIKITGEYVLSYSRHSRLAGVKF